MGAVQRTRSGEAWDWLWSICLTICPTWVGGAACTSFLYVIRRGAHHLNTWLAVEVCSGRRRAANSSLADHDLR